MKVQRVFVFDPGLTTGVAMAEVAIGRGKAEVDTLNEIRATMKLMHIKFPQEQYGVLKLWETLVDFGADAIVGEDFRLFRVDTSDHVGIIADRILAMMDLLHWMWERGLLVLGTNCWSLDEGEMDSGEFELPTYSKQMPGERSVVTDEFLRRNDLWRTPKHIEGAVTGDSNHAMDALRHLIVYCRKVNK